MQQTLAEVTTEAAARKILEHLNERIRAYYARPSGGRVIVVRLVDVEAELLSWRRARTR